MADLNLHVSDECRLSRFADDTQSLCIADKKEEAIETTKDEANNIIDYYSKNDLVNNSDKASLIYNSKGKGESIELNIGREELKSKNTEKLLGLNISSDFTWRHLCEKLASQLNQKVGLLRRMTNRIPIEKTLIVAEAIFNSKIRYGSCVYLQPVLEKEELKAGTYRNKTITNNSEQYAQSNLWVQIGRPNKHE